MWAFFPEVIEYDVVTFVSDSKNTSSEPPPVAPAPPPTAAKAEPLYISALPKVLLNLSSPVAGEPGLCAVVPTGIFKAVV